MELLEHIRAQLFQQGDMPFVDYMHRALYTPNLGYYNSGLQPFGMAGDFITAPLLTPLFAGALANQCQQVLTRLADPILFEFGAGSGQLCADILIHLEQLGCLPKEYHILEVSGHLQQRQRALITATLPHLVHRVKWLSQWPTQPFSGVVIANEVLDAMPVHRFMQTEDALLESYVTLDKEAGLQEVYKICDNARLKSHVEAVLPRDVYPYQSEANLYVNDWLTECATMLDSGALFILDYGFPRHEYYHPERCHGTLMCHYRHRAHTDPFAHPGEQDITAHVDFTHVADAAYAAGFHVAGYTNQASFLLANGLLSLLAGVQDERERINQQQAVKILLQPSEMGELFKVIALTKQLEFTLNGFLLQDKRVSL